MNKKYLKFFGIIVVLIILYLGVLSFCWPHKIRSLEEFLFLIPIGPLLILWTVISALSEMLSLTVSVIYLLVLLILLIYIYKFFKKNEIPFIFNILSILTIFFLGLSGWTFLIMCLNPLPHWGF